MSWVVVIPNEGSHWACVMPIRGLSVPIVQYFRSSNSLLCHYCSVFHLSPFCFSWSWYQTSPILSWTKTSTENNIQKISDPKWTQNVGRFKWSRSGPCPLGWSRARPSFGLTSTQAIRDLFMWHSPIYNASLFSSGLMEYSRHNTMVDKRIAPLISGAVIIYGRGACLRKLVMRP